MPKNALPQSASATINCRIFPGDTVEIVQATACSRLQAIRTSRSVRLADPVASPASELNEEVMAAVTDAIHEIHRRHPDHSLHGALWDRRHAHAPCRHAHLRHHRAYSCRPEDMFTHGLNERVPVKSFYKALDYWHRVLTDLAGRQ